MATNLPLDKTNLQSFILVWLDASVNDSSNKETQTNLCQLTDRFRAFENSHGCEPFLQSNNERIVLIVSGRLGREVVPRVHSLEQISLIYVYCLNREGNEQWAKNYPKIQKVLTARNDLIEQIVKDNQRQIIPADNKPLYIKIDQHDSSFIDSQSLIYYLLHVKSFISYETQLFTPDEREHLEEFSEFNSSENSLKWLTKDPTPFDLIAQALETKNIDLLFLTRFYLRDIHEELAAHKPAKPIDVYHSHWVTMDEINRLENSIGKLIAINRFFSTISERDQALRAFQNTTDSQKILFEIHADPTVEGIKPFADLKSVNSSQIIFMLGSIFRIDAFSKQDDLWICRMTLTNDNDLLEQIQREDGDGQIDLLSFANMLGRIKQYDHAEKYYQRLLKDLPSNHPQQSICYRNLGNAAYMKKDYTRSIEYHTQGLELGKRSPLVEDSDIADSYNCLGIVYFDQKDYRRAIEHYENSVKILERHPDENYQKVIIGLTNIALVYRTKENYAKALDYYKRAARCEEQYLSENHSDLGHTYHNIGACFWCIGTFDKAMEYYSLSLENKERSLPEKDLSIAMTLENMGLVHENKDNRSTAFEYYIKAADIYRQTLPESHADIGQINQSILRVSVDFNQE